MPPASSEADVNENLTTAPYSAWNENCYCGRTFTMPQPGYSAIITSPDGSNSDIFFMTGCQPASDKIQNSANFTANDGNTYENKVINTYPVGSTISYFNMNTYSEVSYYILNDALMRDRQTIDPSDGSINTVSETVAINIEDLQFSFGLDTTTDGFVDSWIDDRDLTDPEKDQVRLVEINVLGKTDSEHRGYSNFRPAILDNTAGASPDGFRRKQLKVTIKVRNLGLQ